MGSGYELLTMTHPSMGDFATNYDIDLYALTKQRLTMDALKKAVESLAKMNLESLWEIFDEDDDEIIKMVVDDIATNEVLDHINDCLRIVPIVEIYKEGFIYMDEIISYELQLGHNTELVPKLFDAAVCPVGSSEVGGAGGTHVICAWSDVTFLSANGEWKYAHCRSYQDADLYDDEDEVEVQLYEPYFDGYPNINYLKDLIPEKYEGVLYDFY